MRTKKASGWKIFNWFSTPKTKKQPEEVKPKEKDIKFKVSPKDSPKKELFLEQKQNNDTSHNKQKSNVRF